MQISSFSRPCPGVSCTYRRPCPSHSILRHTYLKFPQEVTPVHMFPFHIYPNVLTYVVGIYYAITVIVSSRSTCRFCLIFACLLCWLDFGLLCLCRWLTYCMDKVVIESMLCGWVVLSMSLHTVFRLTVVFWHLHHYQMQHKWNMVSVISS